MQPKVLSYDYMYGQKVEVKTASGWRAGKVATGSALGSIRVAIAGQSILVERDKVRPWFDLLDVVTHAGHRWCVLSTTGMMCNLKPEGGTVILRDVYVYDIHPAAKKAGVPTAPAKSYKDTSKAPLEELLAVPDALEAVARVFRWAHDTKGYGFKQFETLDPSELRDALMRHTFQSGIKHTEVDDQSKMLHAVHMAANGLMYLQNLINRSKAAN